MTDRDDPLPVSLTPIQRRRLAAALAIDDSPTERVSFQHTVLCQTCLPYRDPGDTVRLWKREQGRVSLLIQAGLVKDPTKNDWIELGLPYGPKPRLILAHLNSEALRTGSPEIEVEKSLTAFVKRIGLSGHGRGAGAESLVPLGRLWRVHADLSQSLRRRAVPPVAGGGPSLHDARNEYGRRSNGGRPDAG